MKVLALETSATAGSVAALDDQRLLEQRSLQSQQRSAQSLAPAVHGLLQQVRWRPSDVELIAVTVGPGSFTGLRVGVTTAKMLAYATGAALIGVGTLDAIAQQAAREELWAVLDAFRGEVFAQKYVRGDDAVPRAVGEVIVVPVADWLTMLQPEDAVSGPLLTKLQDRLPEYVRAAPSDLWSPMAATVGRLGWRQFQAGDRDDPWTLLPKYYRKSAAEEKLENSRQRAEGRGQ